jgi:hypothetical protein
MTTSSSETDDSLTVSLNTAKVIQSLAKSKGDETTEQNECKMASSDA